MEGWTPQVLVLDTDNKPVNLTEASSAMKIFVDSGKNAVVVSVPLEYFGDGEPGDWGATLSRYWGAGRLSGGRRLAGAGRQPES